MCSGELLLPKRLLLSESMQNINLLSKAASDKLFKKNAKYGRCGGQEAWKVFGTGVLRNEVVTQVEVSELE